MVRVLLVENDANLNLLYRVRLKQAGYEVSAVDTGVKALAVVLHERIDVVLMDLALPDYDGLQLLDRIISYNPLLPVIIHTDHEFWSEDFRSWGAAAYVLKSPDFSKLLSTLRQFASTAPTWRELVSQAQAGGGIKTF
ncbi:MAG: Virulence transcriptional regulatory protein PhoP [bacterium]|nr:Virulence transcriptional regulatory protein PhoP [bacterium]